MLLYISGWKQTAVIPRYEVALFKISLSPIHNASIFKLIIWSLLWSDLTHKMRAGMNAEGAHTNLDAEQWGHWTVVLLSQPLPYSTSENGLCNSRLFHFVQHILVICTVFCHGLTASNVQAFEFSLILDCSAVFLNRSHFSIIAESWPQSFHF